MPRSQTSVREISRIDLNAITLASKNTDTAKEFYGRGLGFALMQDQGRFVSFDVPGVTGKGGSRLALYGWDALADDARTSPGSIGFRGFTLSAIVDSPDAVDQLMARAERAGGRIQKAAKAALWGGYSGYFADPDGHLWKVATGTKPARGRKREGRDSTAEPTPTPTPLMSLPVTLAAASVKRTRDFYVRLGAEVNKDYGRFVSLKLGRVGELGLYRSKALAKDAEVNPEGSGFHGFTLSWIVDSAEEVDTTIRNAERAGGRAVVQPAQNDWGGYSAYFADPDGNLWKVAAAS